MAEAIQDKNHPNIWRDGDITIIKIPELGENTEMRFHFISKDVEIAGKLSKEERQHGKGNPDEWMKQGEKGPVTGVTKNAMEIIREDDIHPIKNGRDETEKLLDKMFNHPEPAEKKLQHDFNELIVKTYNNYKDVSGNPIPLDVGTTTKLTPSEFGGALLEEKNGQPVLAINLESMKQAKYIYTDTENGIKVNKNHDVKMVDIARHEFFHYIDTYMQGKANGEEAKNVGEPRAVWYVNQFQAARGEPERASYSVTNDEKLLKEIKETPGVLDEKMPNGIAPSLNNLRTYNSIKNENKEQKAQPQSSTDTQLLPGLAGFSTASKLFLSTKSGLLPEDQDRIQSIVDSKLAAHNTVGKDIVMAMNDSRRAGITNDLEPKLG